MKVIITPQKALELLTDYALKRRIDHSDKYIIKAYSGTIKEAISKETPMKPIVEIYRGREVIGCGVCGEVAMDEYCSGCGQKIDWSDEE